MSRLPHFLDSTLMGGGEVVSLIRGPVALFLLRKIPGTEILKGKVKISL
jgi:hypothetical protein